MMELADVLDSKSSGSDTVRVRPPLPAPAKDNKKDIVPENPDFIGVFAVSGGEISRVKIVDIKWIISLCGRD